MTHPLDKPIWSALTSRQAHFAQSGDLARSFPADVSPFAAARDGSRDAALALADRVPADGDISLLEVSPPRPPPGVSATELAGVQMALDALPSGGKAHDIIALGDADAPDMLALALLTKPGPFRARTHTMGRFIGIRDGARLVAMGGERLALNGFTEVTALCTHPDYRGRGYGEALLRAVSERILADGLRPFLHVYAANTGAIALYERMGFNIRARVTHAVWKRAAKRLSLGMETPTLSAPGLVLRPLLIADAPALFAAHADPEVHQYWSSPAHTDVEETARYIQDTLNAEGARVWAITEDGGEALGRIALFDVRDGVGEFGLLLRREAQGRGLASKALALIEAYAFSQLGMHRLQADADPDNSASIGLFLRAGFQREGLLRGAWKTHLGIRDSVVLGKLKP